MMVRWAIATALLFGVVGTVSAQVAEEKPRYVLSGTITDTMTGARVSAVAIRLDDLRRAVLTDSTGTFILPDLPAGVHAIEITRIGYRPRAMTVELKGNTTIALNVVPQPISLEAITAVTHRLARRRERVSSTVRAFDGKSLALAMTDMKSFLAGRVVPVVMCPSTMRGQQSTEPFCVVSRGAYRELHVYLNDMPFIGAAIDMMESSDFELAEYYAASATLRLYTAAFIERVASGKQHISSVLP